MSSPRISLLAGAVLGLFGTASAQELDANFKPLPITARPAVEIVRTLQLLQDQVATGSVEAHASQRGLLGILESRLVDLDASAWNDERNTDAAVIFALSGGSPKILRHLLSNQLVTGVAADLVQGALAYVEGRGEEAKRLLMPIEARLLRPGLGAQLALVQSALIVGQEPARAMSLLDFVRLQATGTLLEEAALRRQVFVARQIDDFPRFETLSSDYLRRYRHSIYAGNFRQRLAAALAEMDYAKDPARFSRMVGLLTNLEPKAQRDLYLMAARNAVENGRIQSALLSAEMAMRLAENSAPDIARAKLYQASAMVVSPRSLDMGLRDLRSIDRSLLGANDLRLLDTALGVGKSIKRLPGEPEKPPEASVNERKQVDEAQASAQLPALRKAQEALSGVDRLFLN
ncbi:chemotaxis protein [Bosea sp. 2KB_26]|uniref:chemotaxis protein n=1 Tax=Bosea sp. 2KB_26 TaxID=3237475 RepID=UPI003F93CC4D